MELPDVAAQPIRSFNRCRCIPCTWPLPLVQVKSTAGDTQGYCVTLHKLGP